MSPASPTARYWNDRLDPLDWNRARRPTGRARWERAYATFLSPDTRCAIDWLGDLRGRRVLELGCGQGYGSLHLARGGARVVGLDLSEKRCAVARRETAATPCDGRLNFCSGQALRLPFASGTFDAVFSRDVLMYARPDGVARECLRVLVPGAPAVFVESLAGNPVMAAYRRLRSNDDYRSFTRHLRWAEMSRLAGDLQCERVRPFYLVSLLAFFGLFALGSVGAYHAALRLFFGLDAALLSRFPLLSRFAWRATALYRKPGHAI